MSNNFSTAYFDSKDQLPGREFDWLNTARDEAIARFEKLGLPTRKHEEWKYTPLHALAAQPFDLPLTQHVDLDGLANIAIPDGDYYPIVFVDGHYQPSLSHLPINCVVKTFEQLVAERDEKRLQKFFSQHYAERELSFGALNQAALQNGLFIKIPAGHIIDKPLHCIYISKRQQATHLRNVIIAKPSAQCKIIETYVSDSTPRYFNNVVTDIHLDENACVEHYKLQTESRNAYHIANLIAHCHRDSQLHTYSLSTGGSLVRSDIHALLLGENSHCHFDGLFMVKDKQHIDHHTTVEHKVAHTRSDEYYKGIIDGHGRGVFNGKVIVHPDAQQTHATQMNKNLLLSDNAEIYTKPQLEIFADDVKCTHGATIGQLDKQALFYLQARGVEKNAALSLLTEAFALEIVNLLPLKFLSSWFEGKSND